MTKGTANPFLLKQRFYSLYNVMSTDTSLFKELGRSTRAGHRLYSQFHDPWQWSISL
jgi:hypothetical protein